MREDNFIPNLSLTTSAALDTALINIFDVVELLAALAHGTAPIEPGALAPVADALRRVHNSAVNAWEILQEPALRRRTDS